MVRARSDGGREIFLRDFGAEGRYGDCATDIELIIIAQFASYEGVKGGEFYTPASVVKTIVGELS